MHFSEKFSIQWNGKALKVFKSLDSQHQLKLTKKLHLLSTNPKLVDIKKLHSTSPLYRIRCGDFRIVFKISVPENMVYICALGHRKDIYRVLNKLENIYFNDQP